MKVCVGLLFPLSAPSKRTGEPLVPWQIFTFFCLRLIFMLDLITEAFLPWFPPFFFSLFGYQIEHYPQVSLSESKRAGF